MNSNKKNNISGFLKKKNVKRFSLFVVIAFIFLIFSKLSNDYKQTIKLKVNVVNIQDEIVLQGDSVNTINAYIEAKGFSLIPFMFKGSTDIVLDGKTDVISRPNQFIFDVQKHQYLIEGQLGKSYKVISLKPDTLLISYSKSASKVVPISLIHSIEYALGYDVKEDLNLSVDSVKVVGPSSEIDKIETLETENLELKNVKKDISEEIGLNISEYDNIEIFPKTVNISGEVTKFTEGTIEIPIIITNKPNNVDINYFPKTVTIAYYVDLDKYNSITTKDFMVECNYANIDDNQTYFMPVITKKPESVKRISIKQKRIDFIKL
ncbi:YbbR-like domain-containing protein [uncultured Winogradskyella sp.]|uniref:YbbR-like domain-containing protein n=1 Tax=uncultured Winogradskyella sp. TaxID=395353 RepID=UPI00260AEFD8|nr:YbbR-like domain-containing protein [uncultured Winogradskyella sp.]